MIAIRDETSHCVLMSDKVVYVYVYVYMYMCMGMYMCVCAYLHTYSAPGACETKNVCNYLFVLFVILYLSFVFIAYF